MQLFLIMIQIATPAGSPYFVRPLEGKYQAAYAAKADCERAARPLARQLDGRWISNVLVKGVACLPSPFVAADRG